MKNLHLNIISFASIIGLAASILEGFILPTIFFFLSALVSRINMKVDRSPFLTILVIFLSFISSQSIGQTKSSNTIAKTVRVENVILLNVVGEIEIIETKTAITAVIETKIETTLPIHIQEALVKVGKWEVLVYSNNASMETLVSLEVKPMFYNKKDIEQNLSFKLYVPEGTIVKRI